MPEALTWVLFGAGAALLLERAFRWLAAHEREPTEAERAEALRSLGRLRAR